MKERVVYGTARYGGSGWLSIIGVLASHGYVLDVGRQWAER